MSTSCPLGCKEYSRLLVERACYLAREKRRIGDGKSSRLRSLSPGRTSSGSPGGTAPIFELRSWACITNWSMKSPKPSYSYSKRTMNCRRGLKDFASEQKLASASFKAIGALLSVRLGWLNWETKQYEQSVFLDEHVELLSLISDVALKDGEPQVHAHAV